MKRLLTVALLFALLAPWGGVCAQSPKAPGRPAAAKVASSALQCALIPMITLAQADDATIRDALERDTVGGVTIVYTWAATNPSPGVFRFNRLREIGALCHAYGKLFIGFPYTGKWAPLWLQSRFTFYGNQVVETYAGWDERFDPYLEAWWAAQAGVPFDVIFSSGVSPLNGMEIACVVQNNWTARYAMSVQGYEIGRYKAALIRQIDRTAKYFPNAVNGMMMHYQIYQIRDALLWQQLNDYGRSRLGDNWMATVGFMQGGIYRDVVSGSSAGTAVVLRDCMRTKGRLWGVTAWNPKSVAATVNAAWNCGANWIVMPRDDCAEVW